MRMKRYNYKNNKTNTLLSKSLLELLEIKDLDEIKVNEICSNALVHKTTFYNHFEDKYDLFNYVIEQIHEKIKEQADKDNGIINYYLSIAKEYIKSIKENPKLFKSVIKLDNSKIGLSIFYELYIHDVESELKKLNINIPTNYVAKFYVNGVFAIINEWFISGMIENDDTIIKYIELLTKNSHIKFM